MTLMIRPSRPVNLFNEFAWPFFRDFPLQAAEGASVSNFGATDIAESDKRFVVTVDLPGARKEDVHVHVEEGYLSVSATVNAEREEKDDVRYLLRERHSGMYSRKFRLPDAVDADRIEAEFREGTLTLTLPKVAPESKVKPVKIK